MNKKIIAGVFAVAIALIALSVILKSPVVVIIPAGLVALFLVLFKTRKGRRFVKRTVRFFRRYEDYLLKGFIMLLLMAIVIAATVFVVKLAKGGQDEPINVAQLATTTQKPTTQKPTTEKQTTREKLTLRPTTGTEVTTTTEAPTEAPTQAPVTQKPTRRPPSQGGAGNNSTPETEYIAPELETMTPGPVQETGTPEQYVPTIPPTEEKVTSRVEVTPPTEEQTTEKPTEAPTETPTEVPTQAPTEAPTEVPTEAPTQAPTEAPTETPTEVPTQAPTEAPTEAANEAITTFAYTSGADVVNVEVFFSRYKPGHATFKVMWYAEETEEYEVQQLPETYRLKVKLPEGFEKGKLIVETYDSDGFMIGHQEAIIYK